MTGRLRQASSQSVGGQTISRTIGWGMVRWRQTTKLTQNNFNGFSQAQGTWWCHSWQMGTKWSGSSLLQEEKGKKLGLHTPLVWRAPGPLNQVFDIALWTFNPGLALASAANVLPGYACYSEGSFWLLGYSAGHTQVLPNNTENILESIVSIFKKNHEIFCYIKLTRRCWRKHLYSP